MFFLKGTTFIYAGCESCDPKMPSLFEIDLVDWSTLNKYGIVDLIKKCSVLKKDLMLMDGVYDIHLEEKEIAHITYKYKEQLMECIFNLGDEIGSIDSKLLDGEYVNLFNNEKIIISDGKLPLYKDPVIIKK